VKRGYARRRGRYKRVMQIGTQRNTRIIEPGSKCRAGLLGKIGHVDCVVISYARHGNPPLQPVPDFLITNMWTAPRRCVLTTVPNKGVAPPSRIRQPASSRHCRAHARTPAGCQVGWPKQHRGRHLCAKTAVQHFRTQTPPLIRGFDAVIADLGRRRPTIIPPFSFTGERTRSSQHMRADFILSARPIHCVYEREQYPEAS